MAEPRVQSVMGFRAVLCLLAITAACGGKAASTTPPVPGTSDQPVADTTPHPVDPELRRLLLQADLVLLGDVDVTVCHDGCRGLVTVEAVIASSIPIAGTLSEVHVTSAPPDGGVSAGGPQRAIVFAYLEPHQTNEWRLILTRDFAVGLAPSRAHEVEVAHATLPRATNPDDVDRFADALDTLRDHDQSRWDGAPIVDPARLVFENLDLRGLGKNELVALIGAPVREDAVATGTMWSYTFHDGEQGVLPRIYLAGGESVSHVDVMYGQ